MKRKLLIATLAITAAACGLIGFSACDKDSGEEHKHSVVHVEENSATCTKEGNKEYYSCPACGTWFSDADGQTEITDKSSVVIPKKKHELTAVDRVEATCKTDGNTAYYTCSECGNWFADEDGQTEIADKASVVIAKGHKFTDSVCAACGIHKPTEGLEYTEFGGSYTVSGIGTATDTEIYIADEYNGEPVTEIGYKAFLDCSNITSIFIPDTVTRIFIGIDNGSPFGGCDSLTNLSVAEGNTNFYSKNNCIIENSGKTLVAGCKGSVIPDDGSVTSIEHSAFWHCTGLTSLTVPDKITSIGFNAFNGCSGLKNIIIPESVTEIQYNAFNGCSNLTSATASMEALKFLPKDKLKTAVITSGTSINSWSFNNWDSLEDMTLPDTVTFIDALAFSGCVNLKNIQISQKNTKYHSKNNCIIETASKKLIVGCKGSIIPDDGSVISLGDYAFKGTGITSVLIPACVTYIGTRVFVGCKDLTEITVAEGNSQFYSQGNCLIKKENAGVLAGCKSSVIPDDGSVTAILANAFAGCSITSISIPNNVTYIGAGAFDGCANLTEITLSDEITFIGDYALRDCAALKRITFNGTRAQWESIRKGIGWCPQNAEYTLHCADDE